eukprot:gene21709-biopygen30399
MSQLLLAPTTTSLLDLPEIIISSIVDILLTQARHEGIQVDADTDAVSVGQTYDDIASFRLTCSMLNSFVFARATRLVSICPKQESRWYYSTWSIPSHVSLPVRVIQTMSNLQTLDLTRHTFSPLGLVGLPTTITTLSLGGPKYPLGIYPKNESLLDLSPLSTCTGLIELDISRNRVADLSPLAVCKALEMIDRSFTKVSDLSPLSVCLKLRNVNCSQTNVSDISPLSACSELCKVNCTFTSVREITSLAACPQLRSILCDHYVVGLTARETACGDSLPGQFVDYHPAFPEVTFDVDFTGLIDNDLAELAEREKYWE